MGKNDELPQFLTFQTGGDEYAVGILQVKEILECGTVTRVPSMPEFVRGVINLRGSVVPVVDLAVKLGLPATTISRWSCVVIVEVVIDGDESVVGVLVDAVGQVLEIPRTQIEPPPSFGTRARAEYLQGMGKVEGKLLMILDIDKLLGSTVILDAQSAARSVSSAPPSLSEAPPQ